ncbi:PP0621 family protein [Helicobacter mustelae]|uniref:Prokaryotic metallothionein n=1 Tax=Helicobacter mustelae (strain ATCC 43772 / CCUG 25715 / CIP 103759 / LMG 18044 / NCTC 12198 / R85-136P) TaxID=679897 RepID=D3UFV5_HELM1|nr:PP0621 family protein [Helicobacter mustelae]CBG39376.1 Putative hypothetical protein [Helicobacter mustelae 12198]SQH70889.1 Uncharacterised protein [Helicobacter mustelae]STP12015.1 Uncharacterised protein [Helicobacter mustelae]
MKFFVLLLLILGGIWFFFREKKPIVSSKKNEEEMLECAACGVFASNKEMLLKNGKHYCSKACEQKGA